MNRSNTALLDRLEAVLGRDDRLARRAAAKLLTQVVRRGLLKQVSPAAWPRVSALADELTRAAVGEVVDSADLWPSDGEQGFAFDPGEPVSGDG